MNKRLLKQLLYGLLFLIIIFGIGFYFYYLNTRPTCFDGVQNGLETGADCGGECTKACLVIAPFPVSIQKLKVPGDDYFLDVLVKVTNPNKDYGAGNIQYTFGEINSDFYVLPAQTKHLVIHSSLESEKASLNVADFKWEKLNLFKAADIDFVVKNSSFKSSELEAVVYNNSDFDFDTVDVVVILYGEEGNVLGVNKTALNTLLSRTDRYFKVSWPNQIDGVVRSEVEVNTNIFNNSNFLRRYGTPEEFKFKEN